MAVIETPEALTAETAQTRRTTLAVVLAITLFAALVRVPRLHMPPAMVFDEIYYAKAARQYLARQEITEERTHPPLSKLLIAGAMRLVGDHAVGWRIAPAIAGTALIPVVYGLAHLLFRDRFVAAMTALLLALDGLALVESRIAKPDIFLTLFLFGGFAAFLRFVRGRLDDPARAAGRGIGWLYLTGLCAGAAVSTKWTTLAPLAVIPVMFALLRGPDRLALSRRDLAHIGAAFAALPAGIYLLTYIPYFVLGHSIPEFIAHQKSMFQFHATLTQGHPYTSPWWSWPLLLRPIWYEFSEGPPQIYRGILAVGNPIVWWAGLPAFAVLAVRAVRRRTLPEMFVVVGLAFAYLQYAAVSRVLFLYHFLPSVPFLCMALAVALARIRERLGTGVVLIYLILAAGWFVLFYPVLTAHPIAAPRYWRLMWFGTWI